jgi:hypothetical protein
MTVYLVRHAVAASRRSWHDDDELRPLTAKGERQAIGLAELLHDEPIKRVLSSPALRCVQTVTPLAKKLGAPVEATDPLREGAPFDNAWDVLIKAPGLVDQQCLDLAQRTLARNPLLPVIHHDRLIPNWAPNRAVRSIARVPSAHSRPEGHQAEDLPEVRADRRHR